MLTIISTSAKTCQYVRDYYICYVHLYVCTRIICSCILHRHMQLCALSLLGLYHPKLVVCQAMDYVDSLRSLGQWLTDAAIGRQTAPPPLNTHPVDR